MVLKNYKVWFSVTKEAFSEFSDDKAIKLSASLAYYTIFSISPMLIVIISLCGIFFGAEAVEGRIYAEIHHMIGKEAALQVQNMIKNVDIGSGNYIATIIGLVTLLIGATGVFAEIQDSINLMWGIKVKYKKGWLKLILNRLLSFSIVVSMGFVLMVSLLLSAFINIFSGKIIQYIPSLSAPLAEGINLVITFFVISILFAIIFKVLPDAKISWRDARIGSLITGVLFMLGKAAIGFYLSTNNLGFTYGAATSIVVILLWVYYSSIILYFGAEFTQAYANRLGQKITPKEYAVFTKNKEVGSFESN